MLKINTFSIVYLLVLSALGIKKLCGIFSNEICDSNVPDLMDVSYSTQHSGCYYTHLYGQGWYKMPPGNWQIPYTSQICDVCPYNYYIVYLKDELPNILGEEPRELMACIIRKIQSPNCILDITVKIRICEENTQYFLPNISWSYLWSPYCFVPSKHEFRPPVHVQPELKYRTDVSGDSKMYRSYLQFNCIPEFNETVPYKVKWYVGKDLIKEIGPTNVTEDSVLTEEDIGMISPGFEVQCSFVFVNESIESNESRSDVFFAGFQVLDSEITVNKRSLSTVRVKQTIPIGCDNADSSDCAIPLVLFDSNLSQNPCNAGINVVNADNNNMCTKIIEQSEGLFSEQTYKFQISTIDQNYDDADSFDLQLQLGNDAVHPLWQGYSLTNINVKVTDDKKYQNKLCYSHVDPHMRTADGVYYENQKPGHYMLYRHNTSGTEVQEKTKYCFGGNSGPVCTCGIVVRAGRDVFMINRCGRINYLDFVRCDDGGIIQVEKANDFKYKIVTPTGTQIVVSLHGASYQNTMNVDIIMSAKDYENTEGLCGYFDGNPSNDFIQFDGSRSSNNLDYRFSDSWRLSDELNLFNVSRGSLQSWAEQNGVACLCSDGVCKIHRRRDCERTYTSITNKKCEILNRKKRELGQYNYLREVDRLYRLMLTPRKHVEKRSASANVNEEEANTYCNQSITAAPAIQHLSNKTANEDPSEVINQCVYDVHESNDPSWANVHVAALNDIAKNILELNPVYVANNTEEVEVFLQQTCLKNCSSNGICLENGVCNCTKFYRGPDCSFDIREPVVIEDVQGGGECDTVNSSDCSCLTIRTDHIFEGFFCQISLSRIYNNTQEDVLVAEIKAQGTYEDIFTGRCCLSDEGRNFLEDQKAFVYAFNISASNDGNTFGEPQTVYIYDSSCHDIYINGSSTDISLKCKNGGSCTLLDSEYACTCANGFEGVFCETDVNECLSDPCLNNGNCTDAVNGYRCNCTGGYEGLNCETDVNECLSGPCQHGGGCTDKINGFICNCTEAFSGTLCEIEINECVSQPCQNEVLECPRGIDYLNYTWRRGIPGKYTIGTCPNDYSGEVKRFCDIDGVYQEPFYNCTSTKIAEIFEKVLNKNASTSEVLDDLVNVTATSNGKTNNLLSGDLEAVNQVMAKIIEIIEVKPENVVNVTDSFVETANNILDESTTKSWTSKINQNGSGADTVLENLDRFVEKIANVTTTTGDLKISKSNLFLKVGSTKGCKEINFPNREGRDVPSWAEKTADRVHIYCSSNFTSMSYSSVMYRNLSKILPSSIANSTTTKKKLSAAVMSFSLFPKTERKLDEPIEITFQLFSNSLVDPLCSFWSKNNSSQGSWSSEGCWLDRFIKEKKIVICKCDHLTNFAVLMSPSTHMSPDHDVALSVISMVGCILSMLCLALTVVIHGFFWRAVKSEKSILNINLSCVLFVAYLFFLTGVNQTENKNLCTAIAVFLHLLFLVVFFIMLSEGLMLANTVIFPFSSRRIGMHLLVGSYVLAIVIVAVTMGSVKLEGYGGEKFCWLSTSSGLIWAFLVPVLFVIVINLTLATLVIRKMFSTAAMSKKTDKEKAKAGIRSIVILMPVMGITWLFGIFSVNRDTVAFQYLFALFNSIQGVLIFVFHCVMSKKVQLAFRNEHSRWQTLRRYDANSSSIPSTKITKSTDESTSAL